MFPQRTPYQHTPYHTVPPITNINNLRCLSGGGGGWVGRKSRSGKAVYTPIPAPWSLVSKVLILSRSQGGTCELGGQFLANLCKQGYKIPTRKLEWKDCMAVGLHLVANMAPQRNLEPEATPNLILIYLGSIARTIVLRRIRREFNVITSESDDYSKLVMLMALMRPAQSANLQQLDIHFRSYLPEER